MLLLSSSFLSKFYILFLFSFAPRIDRFLDLFQKLDESGVRWIIRNVVERVSETRWKMFWWKSDLTFFESRFVWILPSFKLLARFLFSFSHKRENEKKILLDEISYFLRNNYQSHFSIRFLSLEILFGEYTLYIHFRRILLFLLVSRWTGHAVVNSCWREKEETTNERGYMDREIASGRPSAAGVSSFFDSLNGKLKRFG